MSFIPLALVLLIFGAYLAMTFVSSAPSLQSRNTQCSTTFDFNSGNPISVLTINSNSTGTICVKYSNLFNNYESNPSYISVYQFNSSGIYGVCKNCDSNLVTREFQLSANPATVDLARSASEIVTYTIKVPSNITSGIFGVFLFQFCSLFPVAIVEQSGMQLSSSEFSYWYPHSGSCPAQFLNAKVLGVGGFQVQQLN